MDKIKEIIGAFEKADIQKMKMEYEGLKLELEKGDKVVVSTEKPVEEVKPEKKVQGTQVKAPLVGVYYERRSPEVDPFVKVGDFVHKGDTLCIIEAMKVMNEIYAPVDGKITEILVKNEDLCEYDQILMMIEEANV